MGSGQLSMYCMYCMYIHIYLVFDVLIKGQGTFCDGIKFIYFLLGVPHGRVKSSGVRQT